MQLVRNAIQTPDGTILESKYRHDYKTYKDAITNEEYMVDGGLDYIRTNVNKIPAKELYVYIEDGHEKVRESFSWGTYGKKGDEEKKWVLLKDLSSNHIKAILDTQYQLPVWMKEMFKKELSFRAKK